MLKLRTIGLSDYSVLEGGQRIGRYSLGHRTDAVRVDLECQRPPARRIPMGSSVTTFRSRMTGGSLGHRP